MSSLSPVGSVCLLNGSLRGHRASSFQFLNSLDKRLRAQGMVSDRVSVEPEPGHVYSQAALDQLSEARVVVLAAPLYGYCLPGGLMNLLEAWARHLRSHPPRRGTRFYGMINCGFVVPETIAEGIRVLEHFCVRVGFEYRFSVAIASGLVAALTEPVDFRLRSAYQSIVSDIIQGNHDPKPTLYLKPLVPRIVMDIIREHLDARVQRSIDKAARKAGLRHATRRTLRAEP